MIRKETWVEYLKILDELDYPPAYLIDHEHFAMLDGKENRSENMVNDMVWGISWDAHRVFALHPWLEGKERTNVIYHEIAHILWPYKPHWWIEAFAEKMARGGGKGTFCRRYNHSVRDLPPRKKLLEMARKRGNKLKQKIKTT